MSNYNIRTLNYLKELQNTIPDFNIKYKNQSLFIKILGFILFFNKEFMTTLFTTIGIDTVSKIKNGDIVNDDPSYNIIRTALINSHN